jgi:hypothetical protein
MIFLCVEYEIHIISYVVKGKDPSCSTTENKEKRGRGQLAAKNGGTTEF